MTSQDWLLFLAALSAVGAVAYALGARRSAIGPETVPARALATEKRVAKDEDDDDEVVSVGKPKIPEQPVIVEQTDDDEEAAAAPAAAPAAPLPSPPPPEAPKPAEPPAVASVPKLFTEEESEEDDVDVTRVGSLGVPPLRNVIQPPVILLDKEGISAEDEPAGAEPYFLVTATAQTDTGLRRKQNEDSLLVQHDKNLFVVADGMGGHKGGETASRLAVKAIEDAFVSGTYEGDPHAGISVEGSELARAMQMANATILETAKANRDLEGMGTTLCCARFSPTKRRMHIGHVGDSRCYRLRDGTFKQLTADHTMADLGMTGPESANLSRAVGIWSTVPIDVIVAAPLPGDAYLLCSDGLTKMLDDDRIAQVLRTEEDAQAAVDRLIFFANSRGGKDNITVILIRVVDPAAAKR
jgi:serine/threonine protein phosphatase PrpC